MKSYLAQRNLEIKGELVIPTRIIEKANPLTLIQTEKEFFKLLNHGLIDDFTANPGALRFKNSLGVGIAKI